MLERAHVALVLSRGCLLGLALTLAAGCKKTPEPTVSETEPDRSVVVVSREPETDANVRAALAAEGCKVTRQDRRVFYIQCGDSGDESGLNLENLDEVVKAVASAEERRAQAQKFVQRLTRDTTLPEAPPLEKLLLVIRPQEYVQASAERMGADGGGAPKMVTFPFAGSLAVFAALDTPDNIKLVPISALGPWKLDEASVYSRAIENLDAHPLTPERIGGSEGSSVAVYRLTGAADENEASRLLSPKSRASLEKVLGGRAMFAIPDRRQLLAAKAADARAVAALREITNMYAQGPLRISGDLFEVDERGKLRVAR